MVMIQLFHEGKELPFSILNLPLTLILSRSSNY